MSSFPRLTSICSRQTLEEIRSRESRLKADRTKTGVVRCLLCFATLLCTCTSYSQASQQTGPALKKPLIYQIGQTVHIHATGSRPLLQAIDALQRQYGWAVDYEDPQYLPTPAGRPSPPNRREPRSAATIERGFGVQFEVPADGRPDEQSILTTVVDAYNQSEGAAQFKVVRENDRRWAVVGVGARGPNNEIVTQQPILDFRIRLVPEQRTAGATIELICQKVSAASELSVSAKGASPALHEDTALTVGGSDVPARELLLRTLASMGSNLYWCLLYDADEKSYALNIKVAESR